MTRLARRAQVLLLALGVAGGCGTKAPATTGLVVTVKLPMGVGPIDQLKLTVRAGDGSREDEAVIVGPVVRPETAGAALKSPQSVTIFLADERAGQDVDCAVAGLSGAVEVAHDRASQRLVLNRLVPLALELVPDPSVDVDAGDDGGAHDAAGAGDAPPPDGGGASDDGASDVAVGLKVNGSPCLSGGECDSTACVDGVCCGSACTGPCESCNQKGQEGACSPVPVGTTTPECVDQGVASCGFDGTCNGSGACRRYAAGAPCKAAACAVDRLMPASACDGLGACLAPSFVACTPFLCGAVGGAPQCRTTCTATSDCTPPAVCTNNSCGPKVLKANGQGCAAAGDCLSNRCTDGVCCATACAGACMACNVAGAAGTCAPVPAGKADPRGVCKDGGAAACKQNGLCNGAGACALYPATTTCQAGACAARFLLGTRRCDGAGTCTAGVDADCAPYRCDPTKAACFTSCTANAQCATPPRRCTNNVCQ